MRPDPARDRDLVKLDFLMGAITAGDGAVSGYASHPIIALRGGNIAATHLIPQPQLSLNRVCFRLGLGISPPVPTWGIMLQDSQQKDTYLDDTNTQCANCQLSGT